MAVSVSELSRSALKVYVKLVESSRPLGVRELARELDMPPSTVHYCLAKLEEVGLVERAEDGYVVKKIENPEGFLVFRRRLVPRLTVYSAFFLGVLIAEVAICIFSGLNPDRVVVVLASLVASILFLLEGLRARRKMS